MFNKSPHRDAFVENDFPMCETCHSNHKILKPYLGISDYHTNCYFERDISQNDYMENVAKFTDEFIWKGQTYFHWELEFPEVLLNSNMLSLKYIEKEKRLIGESSV